MQERRKNKRHSLEGKIIIKRLDDANGVREANIDISDVSKTGVGFCCNEILTIGILCTNIPQRIHMVAYAFICRCCL